MCQWPPAEQFFGVMRGTASPLEVRLTMTCLGWLVQHIVLRMYMSILLNSLNPLRQILHLVWGVVSAGVGGAPLAAKPDSRCRWCVLLE